MSGKIRKNIIVGSSVSVVEKQNQQNDKLTKGEVERILTKSSQHTHGIKVKLTSGKVGRVKEIHG